MRSSIHPSTRSVYENDRGYHASPVSTGVRGSLYNLVRTPITVDDVSLQRSTKPLITNESFYRPPDKHKWNDEYTNVRKNSLTTELTPELWAKPGVSKLSRILATTTYTPEERAGNILENELEGYINRIRSLHDKNDPHSLEEIDHEQNTSGDLLNVTLSDDGFDHLPVEEKTRPREIPAQVGQILALADDLISSTVDSPQKSINAPPPDGHLKSVNETHAATKNESTDKINDIVATPSLELDESDENNKFLVKSNCVNDTPNAQSLTNYINSTTAVVREMPLNNSETLNLSVSEEYEVDYQNTKDLEASDLDNFARNIKEIALNENINLDEELQSKSNVPSSRADENNSPMTNQDQQFIQDQVNEVLNEPNNEVNNLTNDGQEEIVEQNQNDYETVNEQNYEQTPIEQSYVEHDKEYTQDPNQLAYQYNAEQYDPNQQYEYDPNVQYQYDQQYTQYVEDPNAQYQQYTDDPQQQYQTEGYVENDNGQYEQQNPYDYTVQDSNYTSDTAYVESQAYVGVDEQQEYQQAVAADNSVEQTAQLSDEKENNDVQTTEWTNEKVDIPNEQLTKKPKNIIKSILESDTESTIEKNSVSNTESDFDFN